jgi:hypothetical protein
MTQTYFVLEILKVTLFTQHKYHVPLASVSCTSLDLSVLHTPKVRAEEGAQTGTTNHYLPAVYSLGPFEWSFGSFLVKENNAVNNLVAFL